MLALRVEVGVGLREFTLLRERHPSGVLDLRTTLGRRRTESSRKVSSGRKAS
ncbi:hypothetical protein ACFFYR_35665 [Paraburkholderia dipogonis]|uniref:hypothetical protein n=1 Tax=Paraburkholderia dipogonis TaxID=1211383 RepID=UPI00141B603C|nr:hypothetical protein [Paraburkholderia dipogonis]